MQEYELVLEQYGKRNGPREESVIRLIDPASEDTLLTTFAHTRTPVHTHKRTHAHVLYLEDPAEFCLFHELCFPF